MAKTLEMRGEELKFGGLIGEGELHDFGIGDFVVGGLANLFGNDKT